MDTFPGGGVKSENLHNLQASPGRGRGHRRGICARAFTDLLTLLLAEKTKKGLFYSHLYYRPGNNTTLLPICVLLSGAFGAVGVKVGV